MLVQSEDSTSRPIFAALARRLSKQAFETWFSPLRITRSKSELRISVPNSAVRDWILSQYSDALEESLCELDLHDCRIEWSTPQLKRGDAIASRMPGESSISMLPLEGQAILPISANGQAPPLPDIPSSPL